jgi:hypothetical protein
MRSEVPADTLAVAKKGKISKVLGNDDTLPWNEHDIE